MCRRSWFGHWDRRWFGGNNWLWLRSNWLWLRRHRFCSLLAAGTGDSGVHRCLLRVVLIPLIPVVILLGLGHCKHSPHGLRLHHHLFEALLLLRRDRPGVVLHIPPLLLQLHLKCLKLFLHLAGEGTAHSLRTGRCCLAWRGAAGLGTRNLAR